MEDTTPSPQVVINNYYTNAEGDFSTVIAKLDIIISNIDSLTLKTNTIIMAQAELIQGLQDMKSQIGLIGTAVDKIGTETQGLKDKIGVLETEVNSADVSPALQAAFDDVKTQFAVLASKVSAVDALVDDSPAPQPQPEPIPEPTTDGGGGSDVPPSTDGGNTDTPPSTDGGSDVPPSTDGNPVPPSTDTQQVDENGNPIQPGF